MLVGRAFTWMMLLPLLLGGLAGLVQPAAATAAPPADLAARVKQLVDQLADKDPDTQDAAAAALIKLGPDALPLLPRPSDKLTGSQKGGLAVVRKTLRDQQVKRDLAPRRVTLDAAGVPLSKVLAEIAKQTDITVEDRREADADTTVKLKLKDVTFWEAIDTVAREADARVSIYERDGKVALRRRPDNAVALPVSYNGLFRTTVRRITATRDLDADEGKYVANLEIAWEPRFRPFLLEVNPQRMTFQDDKGRALSVDGEESNKLSVNSKLAVSFDLPLPSLPRSAPRLGLLKGQVGLVGPTRMDTFAFDATLAELAKDPKAREMTREGVTVKVNPTELAKDHWTLTVNLEYPADGPQFESFESWLVYNEMDLRKKGGDEVFPNNGGYSIDSSAGNRAILSYHFVDERSKKLVRGEPGDWKPVYKTPGLIVEVPLTFEFKDLPLP